MNRKHCEITDPVEIQRILNLTNIGRLATNGADGFPYITPVNFVVWHDNVYFHCARKGEKLDNLIRDSNVCFEVDVPLAYIDHNFDPQRPICHLHQFYHCVIIRGTASIVRDNKLKLKALNALVAKHEGNRDFGPVTEEQPGYKQSEVVEIRPISITAKSDLAQNKSHEDRKLIAEYLTESNRDGDLQTVKEMGFKP